MDRPICPIRLAAIRKPLQCLLKAKRCAKELGEDELAFAVRLQELRRFGVDETDMRWLSLHKYVRHVVETTAVSGDQRTFIVTSLASFGRRSCFVLTESGERFARRTLARLAAADPGRAQREATRQIVATPHWREEVCELRAADLVVKRLPPQAINQITVLRCFQEDRWPPRIGDPLNRTQGVDPVDRLHGTVKGLNRKQLRRLVVFGSDGTGEGISWHWSQEACRHGLAHPWDE